MRQKAMTRENRSRLYVSLIDVESILARLVRAFFFVGLACQIDQPARAPTQAAALLCVMARRAALAT